MAVIQFKRGTEEALIRNNPLLAAGEPIFVSDKNRFKIGDGVNYYVDLPFAGENSIVNASSYLEFPSIGRENVIYKAELEKKIYQWNTTELKYELLSDNQSTLDIEVIHGGNANGAT